MGLFNFSDGTLFEPLDIFEHAGGILGGVQFVIAFIVCLLALIIWRYDKSGYGLSGYLIFVGAFGAFIMTQIALFFAIMLAMGIGMILYKLYESR